MQFTFTFSFIPLHLRFSICSEMKYTLICLLILVCGFFGTNIFALKCTTPDGLQVDEVRKVIKTCMRKIATVDSDDAELKNYDEYENFETDYDSNSSNNGKYFEGERGVSNGGNARRNNDRMNNNYNNNYDPSRVNHNYDHRPQTGGNYNEMNRRNDRHDSPPLQRNPYQPYTYADDNNNFNNQRGGSINSFQYDGRNGNTQKSKRNNNDNSNANATAASEHDDKHERDRSCILQCFFQELKMVCLNE